MLRIGPYRLYFYSHEPNEPPHIHVDRDRLSAKFFRPWELADLERIVQEHQKLFREAWREYFGA